MRLKVPNFVARRPLVAMVTLAAAAMPVMPLSAAPDAAGRYTMSPADGGMLKLDSATGAVSFCTRSGSEWSCAPVKDGEQTSKARIESLEAEVARLKDKLREMEEIAGLGDPGKEKVERETKPSLPTEKDVEQAFDYFERMMKAIRERMQRLEGQGKGGTPL